MKSTHRGVRFAMTHFLQLSLSVVSAASAAPILPAEVGDDWWSQVRTDLAECEYQVSVTEDGLEARNRAHNLRTTFMSRGVEIVPRTGGARSPAWRWQWRTLAFGREGALRPAAAVTPEPIGSRVTYRRPEFDEWYENGKEGLEQGFTVHERPSGEAPLCITGRIGEGLRLVLREDGDVDLLDARGAGVLRYGKLWVCDADSRKIDSHLAVDGDALTIVVDDRDAVYPLVIDPLMTSPAWTVEGNQESATLGFSLATAGDVNGDGFSDIMVGVPGFDNGQGDEGLVFVYQGSASGLSTSAAWTIEINLAFAAFGSAVAPAGDVNGDGFADVIIGHRYFNGELNEGRAVVYHGSPVGLGSNHAWSAEGNQLFAEFGTSVSTAGDVNGDGFSDVIVGALGYENGETQEGRAFVYHGSATGLSLTPGWTAESNQANAHFGLSVATAGDVNGDGFSDVVVGASEYDVDQTDEGRVYVYHGSAGGLSSAADWTADGNQVNTRFGSSLAPAGDVNGDGFSDVIVGAPSFDNGQANEGRAFLYQGSAAGLGTTAAWTAEGNQVGASFGSTVAIAGDVNGDGFSDVIVGAPQSAFNDGRAFAYQGSATGLSLTYVWMAVNDQDQAYLGWSVATAGDVNGDGFSDVIVSAPYFDNGEIDEGRAFAYYGSGAGLDYNPAWTAVGPEQSSFGISVATAGDVNGDGFSDIIVGAPTHDNGEVDEGRAFVYHGSAAGPTPSPAWTAEGNQVSAEFAYSVATAGDVNGDGYSDVIVGANKYENGQMNEGRAFVYHGSATGLGTTPAWTAESNQVSALFGYSVGTAGDVNGDGFSDVIVGAMGWAFVYHGSAAGLAATPAWTAEGNQPGASFGSTVATAGDVNGDGFSDVIIGALSFDNPFDNGAAFVYHGSGTGLAVAPAWTIFGPHIQALFGCSVATAGDVNGDGFSDVIVGARQFTNVEVAEGRAFVYHGSPQGLDAAFAWSAEGNQGFVYFGYSVATAGDVDGDGFSDVIVGAPAYDYNYLDEGQVLGYHGSAAGLAALPDWIAQGGQPHSLFGGCVASAGDVNGDGFSDAIVGAHLFDSRGRTFAFYGNTAEGLHLIPRQARTDDSAPIDLLGLSDSESAFLLKALGRTPAGRGEVRLQTEVKPLGIPFDGTGLITGPATDTGAPVMGSGSAVSLSEPASGLLPETLYRWRLRILTDSPFFPHSRWLSLPYNAVTEPDLRTAAPATAVLEPHAPAAGLWLAPSTPNPFNPRTTIAYVLPARMRVELLIHDVQGRLVRTLVDEMQRPGHHEVEWDGRDALGREASAGIYFCRLDAGGEERFRKLALVK